MGRKIYYMGVHMFWWGLLVGLLIGFVGVVILLALFTPKWNP